jgi:predicted regulator of Ras-like GTPase activity (Roadblock/LC7/MglB family)
MKLQGKTSDRPNIFGRRIKMVVQNLDEVLININRIRGVKDSLVAGLDGIPVTKVDRESSILSATTVAALGAVRELTRTVRYGNLEQLIVETEQGKIVIDEFGMDHVIIVLTEMNANIGMIRVMLKKAISDFTNNQ